MKLVLDASAAFSWIFEDERDDLALAMARIVAAHGAYVPPLFACEAHNILAVAIHRKRMTQEKATEILGALARLSLRVETRGIDLASPLVFAAASHFGLSAYDVTYLVLATELNALLLTRDRQLKGAAATAGVLWDATTLLS